ncbi:replication-relaxation family protein [Streptomyces sp. NPDC101175]|uniref:replication-relaxation family protein n=1 Tax=Streptomyces sp. NPDC101175 TaxID=3366123 RepID=UPI00383250BC
MGGSQTYPYGSTTAVRGHVLAALGVLKVASADQIRRLMCPGHKDSKGVRNAALDLARHGLVLSEGSARDGQKLWGLTPLGLAAAAEALGRPLAEMGGIARGAARSGASHAMAVNETVIAMTGTQPEPTRPLRRKTPPVQPVPAVRTVPPGIGSPTAWSTKVVHPLPGAARTRASVRADLVLRAPEAGLPVLLLEVDRCTEADEVLAAKFARYHQFFRLRTKDAGGRAVPVWQSLYPPTGREGYPPVAVVFDPGTRLGEQALKNRMNRVMDLTRITWSGQYENMGGFFGEDRGGYYNFTDAIPLLFTTLPRLKEHGPLAPVWRRCGHGQWETLPDALANPRDRDAWNQRDEERRRRRDEQEKQQRETARATAWDRPPADDTAPEPPTAAPPEPCERCGRPLTASLADSDVPGPDGRHCADCRNDLAQRPAPTLLKSLFGSHPREPRLRQ